MDLLTELKIKENVRAVQCLHNERLFCVSQKKYVYMYDQDGVEIHVLRDHSYVNKLQFLKYHFLLVSGSEFGDIRYHDISTGKLVCTKKTKKGAINCMKQNRHNAVIHSGHTNGVVSFWTPNMAEPVFKVLAHKGPVYDVDFYNQHYMVTSGADARWKIFDVRKLSSQTDTM